MKLRSKVKHITPLLVPLLSLLLVLCFLTALSNLSHGRTVEDKQRLEDALRRAAVTCYAEEGYYPPSLEYLVDSYGIQIDSRRFTVSYEIYAQNLMPDITVLEK